MKKPTISQKQMWENAEKRAASQNAVMLDLLFGKNPISDQELIDLISRHPDLIRFAGYIGKR